VWDADAVEGHVGWATLEALQLMIVLALRMAQGVLAENVLVTSASYALSNRRYVPVDMGYSGVDNIVPLISATVAPR